MKLPTEWVRKLVLTKQQTGHEKDLEDAIKEGRARKLWDSREITKTQSLGTLETFNQLTDDGKEQ